MKAHLYRGGLNVEMGVPLSQPFQLERASSGYSTVNEVTLEDWDGRELGLQLLTMFNSTSHF